MASEQLTGKYRKIKPKRIGKLAIGHRISEFSVCLAARTAALALPIEGLEAICYRDHSGGKLLPAGQFFNPLILRAMLLGLSVWAFVSLMSAPGSSTTPSTANRNGANLALNEKEANRENYAGDEACQSCHQDVESSYRHTAHHLTSQLPSENSMAGKFTPGSNTLRTLDPNLHFTMTAVKGSYYETAVFWQPPDEQKQTERIDVVVGSGQRGQTYLYWKGDRLFQLPVSYWAPLREWVNSPGYLDATADFNRPVVPRCLECHATYFTALPSNPPQNRYEKRDAVLGISCEKCHGPGRQHIEFERSKPDHAGQPEQSPYRTPSDKGGEENSGIVNPRKLSRARQMDICAECHGGLGEPRAPAFSFVPGQLLADYLELQQPDPEAKLDVHGNQVALLERSRCYQSSTKITCSFCHDVHAPERNAAAYSDRCLSCHKPQSCGEYPKLGQEIVKNCVDCHMPVQDSNLIVSNIVSQGAGKQVKMPIRNHWIKVYATQ